jgi:alpha-beta hydrolase superfamily lysophospholipase
MLRHALNLFAVVCAAALASPTFAGGDTRQVVLSSQTTSLRVQTPLATSPSAAVLVASGADGWRGLTSEVADRLSADGYAVIGLDTRRYLMEAIRRSGALPSAAVGEDYLAVLRRVHEASSTEASVGTARDPL